MLKSRPLCVALFSHLEEDTSELINELLNVTEQNVLKDDTLQRSAKATVLLQHNLERVTEVATRSGEEHPSAGRAFAWLKGVCTKENYGVLRSSGWYPPGTTHVENDNKRGRDAIDLGLDSLDFYDGNDRPDVRNTTLLAWIQTLRPQTDSQERELVITCFENAPERVAAYFVEKKMQIEPKLTNTWIGYASFLFEVIRSPVPQRLGHTSDEAREAEHHHAELPPQTTIILESLLPRPLTQKVLARCLNQGSELITFFAVRILVLAFQKLSLVLQGIHRVANANDGNRKALWAEAEDRLLTRFAERAPPMKDVITTFRRTPDDEEHVLQREATARLLRLYYEITPVQALEEQFDVSTALTAALVRSSNSDDRNEVSEMRALELQHLLVIAKHSQGMKWFSKQGGLEFSPIVSLLKLHVGALQNEEVRLILLDVMRQYDLLASVSELEALLASLLARESWPDELWNFIDDCMARATRQPVKYVDHLEAAQSASKASKEQTKFPLEDSLPGLLIATLAEQAPFAREKQDVVRWVYRFMDYVVNTGHTKSAAVLIHNVSALPGASNEAEDIRGRRGELLGKVHVYQQDVEMEDEAAEAPAPATLDFMPPPEESDNHPELYRWAQKDLALAIEERDVSALMLCLCSKHSDIRRQAHLQLRALAHKLRESSVEDKELFCVLVGELVETFEQQCSGEGRALPYLTGTFATRALSVLQEPTHFIYPKLNRFLIRSPEWRVNRMPAYWLSNTVLSQPEEDDAYWKEVGWVLSWLVDGLRTSLDLEILRRGATFEKVTALYSSPGAARHKVVRQSVVELLYRATCVDGGSASVITRAGVLAWLDMVTSSRDDLTSLTKGRVVETMDSEKLRQWTAVGAALV